MGYGEERKQTDSRQIRSTAAASIWTPWQGRHLRNYFKRWNFGE